jgi:hypothetical protein
MTSWFSDDFSPVSVGDPAWSAAGSVVFVCVAGDLSLDLAAEA